MHTAVELSAPPAPLVDGRVNGHASRRALVARTAWLVTIALVGAGLLGWARLGFRDLPVSLGGSSTVVFATVVLALTYATVGAVIADRRPGNLIAWLFLAVGFGIATLLPVDVLVASAHSVLRPVPWTIDLVAWWNSTTNLSIAATLILAIVVLFPTGRPIGRRWWSVVGVSAVGSAFIAIGTGLRPSGLVWFPTLANPFAAPVPESVLCVLTTVGALLEMAAFVAASASVVIRFRRADPILRTQMRWAAGAAILAGLAAIPAFVIRYVPVTAPSDGAELVIAVAVAGQALVPLGAGIAILRHHLYHIDVLIDRSLVYLPLVGLLGGLYAGSMALGQRVFVALTGDTSDLAIIVSSLFVAWVFTPLRKVLEGFVERRLQAASDGNASPVEPAAARAGGAPGRGVRARLPRVRRDGVVVAELRGEVAMLEERLERLEAALAGVPT